VVRHDQLTNAALVAWFGVSTVRSSADAQRDKEGPGFSTGASSSVSKVVTSKGAIPLDAVIVSQSTNHRIGCPKNAGRRPKNAPIFRNRAVGKKVGAHYCLIRQIPT
jgi:hypothetical protein